MKAMRPRKANWALSEQLQAEQRRDERHRQRAIIARSAPMDGKTSNSNGRRAEATLDDHDAEAHRRTGGSSSEPSRERQASHSGAIPGGIESFNRHSSQRPSETRTPKPDSFTDLD